MFNNSRRSFVKLAAASTAAISLPSFAFGAVPRVVVIGGGAGGATAAKYIAKDSKGAVHVTLMLAYKNKEMENQVMQMIAGRLDNEQIASLALYFNKIK